MKSLYHGKKSLTSAQNFELAYKVREGDVEARKRMVEGNAGFAYKRAIKYAGKNSGWTHIDDDDILQSAMMGLIDAVDKYDPDKGFAFTTYAHFWIIKRIDEEISANHWNTMRPPRNMMRNFLYRKFDYDQSGEYMSKFMSNNSIDNVDESQYDEQGYNQSEILEAVARCALKPLETRVFAALYGENQDQDDLSDLTRKEICDIEDAMLEKIRSHFE